MNVEYIFSGLNEKNVVLISTDQKRNVVQNYFNPWNKTAQKVKHNKYAMG